VFITNLSYGHSIFCSYVCKRGDYGDFPKSAFVCKDGKRA